MLTFFFSKKKRIISQTKLKRERKREKFCVIIQKFLSLFILKSVFKWIFSPKPKTEKKKKYSPKRELFEKKEEKTAKFCAPKFPLGFSLTCPNYIPIKDLKENRRCVILFCSTKPWQLKTSGRRTGGTVCSSIVTRDSWSVGELCVWKQSECQP